MDDRRTVLSHIEQATRRLLTTLASLSDGDLRARSRLPGWSRGHVAAHIARNADSLWRLLEWARTGVEIPQYESLDSRNRDLEAGALRSAAEQHADVRDTADRFAAQARTLPEPAWEATVRAMNGYRHPAWYVVHRRWREVEVHHADLDAGYSDDDWPDAYVRWDLTETLGALGDEGVLAAGRVRVTDLDLDVRVGEGPDVSGSARALLGWLSGRSAGTGLTGGPLPPVPSWPRAISARYAPAEADGSPEERKA